MHQRHTPRGEAGFALPTTMFFVLGVLAILSVGAVAAVNTHRGTVRDSNTKSALAVAEAGAEAALLRYSRQTTSDNSRCLDPQDGKFIPSEPMSAGVELPLGSAWDGWCMPVEGAVEHGTYRYWVRPGEWTEDGVEIEIVSEGRVDTPTTGSGESVRRIRLFAHAETICDPECAPPEGGGDGEDSTGSGGPSEGSDEESQEPHKPSTGFLGDERVVGIDWLDLSGTGTVHGAAGSNGQVTFSGSAKVCGPLRLGPGTPSPVGLPMSQWVQPPEARPYVNASGAGVCYPPGYTISTGAEEYPQVKLPDDIATNNSNHRLTGADPVGADVYQRGNVVWDANTRKLIVNYSELRLQGTAPYFLCQLIIAGSATVVADAPGQPVRIFLDKPENCNNPLNPLIIAGAAKLTSNGYVPGIFILGSTSRATTVQLAGGATTYQMVIYAPNTGLEVSGNFKFNGSLIGKWLRFSGSAEAVPGFDGTGYPIPVEVPEPENNGGGTGSTGATGATGATGGGGGPGSLEYRLVSAGDFTRSNYVECPASPVPDDGMTDPAFECDR